MSNSLICRLASSQIEEYIIKDNFKGTEEYFIKFDEFLQRLKIPADDISYTLFRMFTVSDENVIDFKEYLLHSLFLSSIQEAKIKLVKLLFMVSDSGILFSCETISFKMIFHLLKLYGNAGRIQRPEFIQIMRHFVKLSPTKSNELFISIDNSNRGIITFEDFLRRTEKDSSFKNLYEPNRNFRPKTKSQ